MFASKWKTVSVITETSWRGRGTSNGGTKEVNLGNTCRMFGYVQEMFSRKLYGNPGEWQSLGPSCLHPLIRVTEALLSAPLGAATVSLSPRDDPTEQILSVKLFSLLCSWSHKPDHPLSSRYGGRTESEEDRIWRRVQEGKGQ